MNCQMQMRSRGTRLGDRGTDRGQGEWDQFRGRGRGEGDQIVWGGEWGQIGGEEAGGQDCGAMGSLARWRGRGEQGVQYGMKQH